jgi:nicotine blue oxidoreductase
MPAARLCFNGPVRIAAIILAAGQGRRMGGPKALLPAGTLSFLAHACCLYARPGIEAVIAVLGAETDRVRREAGIPPGVEVVVNPGWPQGMLSSVWRGLDAAEALSADAVLLHPVDHPLVEPSTVDRVADALAQGAFAAVPTWEGRRGHPGGFGRAAFADLRAAPPERGARVVLASRESRVVHVPGGPGCVAGVDTPDQYARLDFR